MEQQIKDAFKYLNDFKRYRAKCDTARSQNKSLQEIERLELNMYKSIDQLELSLRGIQRENRDSLRGGEESENE